MDLALDTYRNTHQLREFGENVDGLDRGKAISNIEVFFKWMAGAL